MSSADTLDIKLHGKEFRVACAPADKENLLAIVAFLDWKMGEIARQTRSTGERLAVMTALNLAHELINLKEEPTTSIDDQELRRRIEVMEARLDAALAPQEQLF
jgi:cell division protein ZapA